jgi:hypothetical protein
MPPPSPYKVLLALTVLLFNVIVPDSLIMPSRYWVVLPLTVLLFNIMMLR